MVENVKSTITETERAEKAYFITTKEQLVIYNNIEFRITNCSCQHIFSTNVLIDVFYQ